MPLGWTPTQKAEKQALLWPTTGSTQRNPVTVCEPYLAAMFLAAPVKGDWLVSPVWGSGGVVTVQFSLEEQRMIERVEGQCPRCRQPLGLLHPTVEVNGVRQHVQPCPEPARPTGERPFSFLPHFPKFPASPGTGTSTGGKPHKQHREDNTPGTRSSSP